MGGKKKLHRMQRFELLRKAYFDACRHYWCVRRCIVRWRERRMQECGSGATLLGGDPLTSLPSQTLVRLVNGRTKHTFYIRDLVKHFETRLQNSDYFIPEPLHPTNPLTAMRLPFSMIARTVLSANMPGVAVRIPQLLNTYWRSATDMDSFMAREFVGLHELALRNEAYEGGAELLQDLAPMYAMAGIPEHCPSLQEAEYLSSINVLVDTHKQPLHSFYVATRSWCEYLSAVGQANLAAQCLASAAEYYAKTSDKRKGMVEEMPWAPIPMELDHPIHPGVLSPSPSPPPFAPSSIPDLLVPRYHAEPPVEPPAIEEEHAHHVAESLDIEEILRSFPLDSHAEQPAAAGHAQDILEEQRLIASQQGIYEEHALQLGMHNTEHSEIDDGLLAAVTEWSQRVFAPD